VIMPFLHGYSMLFAAGNIACRHDGGADAAERVGTLALCLIADDLGG